MLSTSVSRPTPERVPCRRERIGGGDITLWQIQYGKYAGRVVARVETAAGEDLAAALIAARLGRPYGGGGRRSWCAGERAG